MVVRHGFALLVLLAVTGCSAKAHSQAQASGRPFVIPQPSRTTPVGRPHPARPGEICGQITTVSGSHARVIVLRGRTTCAEAMRVFVKYNDPATPAEGTAGLAVIGRWTCETRRTVSRCVSRGTTIETRA